jgi:muconolactone delta-isomerase
LKDATARRVAGTDVDRYQRLSGRAESREQVSASVASSCLCVLSRGLTRVADMISVVQSLPMYGWMSVDTTPLAIHLSTATEY